MANRFINPVPQFFTDDGIVQSGGGLRFLLTGTSTPAATYQDAGLSVPNSNPVPFDSAGRPEEEIFLDPNTTYKVVYLSDYTDLSSVLRTRDPVVDPAANVTAAIQVYPGNPNGNLAGNQGTLGGSGASMVWDTTNNLLYICTTTGDATTAVWTSTTASLSGNVLLTGVISPASISSDQNDYNPPGGDAASEWRLDGSADATLTGFGGGVAGRILITSNVSTGVIFTFPGEVNSTASAAANRFDIAGTITLGPRQTAFWKYDGVSNRWRLLAMTGAWGRSLLTDAATVAWDVSKGRDFQVTLGGNRTLGAFTNGTPGQEGRLFVRQDGTGGRSLSLANAVYDFWGPAIENIARGINEETEYAYKVVSATSMLLRRIGATSIGHAPGRELLAVVSAAAVATVDFVLTKWLSLYDRFEVDFDNLLPATDAVGFHMRTSTDGGATYDAGASDYQWILDRLANTIVDGQVSAADTQIVLAPANANIGLSNVANEGGAAGTVSIHSPTLAARTMVRWSMGCYPANPGFVLARYQGVGQRSTAADVDAIRFLMSSGNITTGVFKLYGCRGGI